MEWAGSSEWGTDAGPGACRQVFSEARQALPCHSTLPPIWSYHQWIHCQKHQMRHKDCYIEQDIMMLSFSQVWYYFSYTCCESNPGCIKVIPWISKAWMGKNSIASISCWTPLPGWELRCARVRSKSGKTGLLRLVKRVSKSGFPLGGLSFFLLLAPDALICAKISSTNVVTKGVPWT